MFISKKSFIRLTAALIFHLVLGVSFSSKAALTDRAPAQAGLETGQRFSVPSAVIQEQSVLAQVPSSDSGYTLEGLL
jgi:hypothetical protein